jgi:hypothetical protein
MNYINITLTNNKEETTAFLFYSSRNQTLRELDKVFKINSKQEFPKMILEAVLQH